MSVPPYRAPWWLPNAHFLTLWGKFARRLRVATRVEEWPTPDDDILEIHRLEGPRREEGTPRLLILHGLEGGPRSHYVGGLLTVAEQRGWGADLLVFRSCGGRLNRTRRFYHSGETTDALLFIQRVAAEHPRSPLLLAGVSLGGNVLLKLLGELGDDVPPAVRAAATISVPYDLARGARYISRGFSKVYERHFLRSLRRKALQKLDRFPGLVPRDRVIRARTLFDFDDAVTAPVHGFASADDYYARSSSLRFLAGIRRPTLLLSAADDPFLPAEVLEEVRQEAAINPSLELEFLDRGGHVGFVTGAWPWRPEYWAERRISAFLSQFATATPLPTADRHNEQPAPAVGGERSRRADADRLPASPAPVPLARGGGSLCARMPWPRPLLSPC